MGNIQVRKNGTQSTTAAPTTPMPWEPSRWVQRMMSWDPFREMTPYLGEDRIAFEPAFEVKETGDAYVFKADVPGLEPADLEVSLTGNRLTVGGKREAEKEEKGDTYYTYERSYGSFTRSFTLPEDINGAAIQANLEKGVLSISVPKKPESIAKKIPIASASEPKKA